MFVCPSATGYVNSINQYLMVSDEVTVVCSLLWEKRGWVEKNGSVGPLILSFIFKAPIATKSVLSIFK